MTDRAPNGRSLRAAPLAREGAVLSRSRPTACRFLDGIGVGLTTGILNRHGGPVCQANVCLAN